MKDFRKEMERDMKAMQDYISAHATSDMTSEEIQNLASEYVSKKNAGLFQKKEPAAQNAKTADDFLELAENENNEDKKRAYAKKALKIDPYCLDAALIITDIDYSDDINRRISRDREVVKKGREFIEKEGYTEDIGSFWGILETRPFMRAMEYYASDLYYGEFYRRSAKVMEEMLRCCENDNLGIRWRLIFIYVQLEEEKRADKLYKEFDDYDDARLMLGMSMIKYKAHKFNESAEFLQRLLNINPGTKRFFELLNSGKIESSPEMANLYKSIGVRMGTIDELLACYMESPAAFLVTNQYIIWAEKKLHDMKANPSR